MKKLAYSLGAIIIAIGLTGCGQPTPAEMKVIKKECQTKDNFRFTQGECLETYKVSGTKQGTINVILHGNAPKASGSMVIGVMQVIAEQISQSSKLTTYYYARPDVSESSSYVFQKQKGVFQQTQEDYIKFNKNFILTLMKESNAKQVNLYGFSAGTTIIQNMIPMLPKNSVNKVVLVAGQLDPDKQMYLGYGRTKNIGGLQPIDDVSNLPKNTKYLLISGDKDSICPTELSKDYSKELTKNGIKNKLVEIKNSGNHKDLFTSDKVLKLASDFLK